MTETEKLKLKNLAEYIAGSREAAEYARYDAYNDFDVAWNIGKRDAYNMTLVKLREFYKECYELEMEVEQDD